MTVSFVIPLWLIWVYLAAGALAAAYSWIVEFWRQSTNPVEVMRHRKFWVRLPIVTLVIVLLWPYAMWTFLHDRRTTRRLMERYRGKAKQ